MREGGNAHAFNTSGLDVIVVERESESKSEIRGQVQSQGLTRFLNGMPAKGEGWGREREGEGEGRYVW